MPQIVEKQRRGAIYAMLGIALLVSLLPFLRSGFYSDDIFNSSLPGILQLGKGETIWKFISRLNEIWLAKGRFRPLGLAAYSLTFDWAPSLLANRVVQVSLVVSNLFAAMWGLRVLGRSRNTVLVFAAIMPALFQARTYYDPILSFSPFLQLAILLMMLTVGLFHRAFEPWRPVFYAGSLIAYAVGLMTYEVTLVSFPLVCILAALRFKWRFRAALWAVSGHAALTLAFVAVDHYLVTNSRDVYAGTQVRVGPNALFAFGVQAVAALPLSYVAFDPQKLFAHLDWPGAETVCLMVIVFVAVTVALRESLARTETSSPGSASRVGLLGGAMVIGPAVLIGMSSRYQEEMRWGLGYLPVYVQIFGLAWVLATAISALHAGLKRLAWLRSIVATGFALVFGGLSALTLLANQWVVEAQNTTLRYPREIAESAARHGLYETIPANSIILRDAINPWDSTAFTIQHAAKPLRFMTTAVFLRPEPDALDAVRPCPEPVYELRYGLHSPSKSSGWATLARVSSLEYRKKGDVAVVLNRTLIEPICYVEKGYSVAEQARRDSVSGLLFSGNLLTNPFRFSVADLNPLRAGPGWQLGKLPPGIYRHLRVEGASATEPDQPLTAPLFLTRPVGVAPEAGNVASLGFADRGAAPPATPLLAGVASGCELVRDSLRFFPSLAPRLELRLPEPARKGFGLAFLVRPEANQVQFAEIVSNHSPAVCGFTLEQDAGPEPNHYRCFVGAENQWHLMGNVVLPPDQWSLVILGFSAGHSALQVIGTIPTNLHAGVAPAPAPDDNQIFLGNWVGANRPFNGQMANFVLCPQPFDAAQVAALTAAYEAWKAAHDR